MNNKNLSVRQIMNRIYKDIDGFVIPKNDEKIVKKSLGSPIYGEISIQALDKLLSYLNPKEDDVLVDLGCGVGKVVLQTLLTTKVRSCIGVELSENRYHDALKAKENSLQFDHSIKQRAVFINDDMLAIDLSVASIIYTCSTAFSDKFMKKISQHLSVLKHNFRLVSLQELPCLKYFHHIETIKLHMSWVKNTAVYIYQKK